MAAAWAVRSRGIDLSPDQDKQVTELIGKDDGMGGGMYGGAYYYVPYWGEEG
jgi:hypothetical protein